MALTSINGNFEKVGTGQLYLVAAPSADPGAGTLSSTSEGYYGLFYTTPADKKTLKGGVLPYCSLTADGVAQKITPSVVEFDHNNGPKTKKLAGIEEASVEFSFFDVDANHLKDAFGLAAGDLLAIAAGAGVAGRKIAAIGANVNYTNVAALYRMPSVQVPGEFDHFLWPLANITPELDVKMNKKDAYTVKMTLSLRESPFMTNAAGNGIIMLADTADAARTS